MKITQKRSIFRDIWRFLTVVFTVHLAFYAPIQAFADAPIYRSEKEHSMQIALTFDDGPHPYLTDRIMDILDQYNAKATFFMVGINVVNYPQAAENVLKRGHEIGNHTFTHCRAERLSKDALLQELTRCEDALEELCEYRPHLFRPPEGALNGYIQHCSDQDDYRLILWSIDTRDWEIKNAQQIAKTVLDNVQPGDIILMHDYIGRGSQTPQALEIILPELIARGYEPVTVSRLLGFC